MKGAAAQLYSARHRFFWVISENPKAQQGSCLSIGLAFALVPVPVSSLINLRSELNVHSCIPDRTEVIPDLIADRPAGRLLPRAVDSDQYL